MPLRQPHPINGVIKNVDDSTVVENATVTIYDEDANDSVSGTTDSNGVYLVDMANMTAEYTIGNNITVEAISGNKIIKERTTITGDEQTVNLTLEYDDALGLIIDLLTDNWDKSTTDLITPTIDRVFNFKEFNLNNADLIVLYEISEPNAPFGIGGTRFEEITEVAIDIRTTKKVSAVSDVRSHFFKMREEVKRIMKANLKEPGRPFQLVVPRIMRDLSNRSVGMSRAVMEYSVKYWGS